MPITEADIEGAERLLGIAYTVSERAQMAGNLSGQIDSALAVRGLGIGNHVPASLRFDPRLPGFSMPMRSGLTRSTVATPLPDDETDIAFAPLTQLSHWIASGAITSRRLTEIYLAPHRTR